MSNIANIKTETLINKADKPRALILLAHGAGADMHHDFMNVMAEKISEHNITVVRFNFPFMIKRAADGKRRPPDRIDKLVDCYKTQLQQLNTTLPIFIGGKSMGGRVAATLVSNELVTELKEIKGIICIGYPFHPVKKPEKLRLAPLQVAKIPVLIVQGERDALGNKDEISEYDISTQCQLVYLEDGDHDLKPRVKSGFTHQQHINSAITQITRFMNEQC